MDEAALTVKFERMKEIIRSLEKVAVAFSAGVDSTFLLKVAVDVLGPAGVVAVTADSDSMARAEFDESRRLTEQMGVEHVVIRTEEMNNPQYRANPANRCYFCKSELFDKLDGFINERKLKAVLAGVNADDYDDWRPGIQAGRERNVRAPVAEAGMSKAEVRELSRRLGLPTFDKPASPCLASRIPYGEEITAEKLRQIEQAESFLRSVGFRECRLRHHGKLARIEVPTEQVARFCDGELRGRVDQALRDIGFAYVAVDLRGFRSGSLNELINLGQVRGS